MKYENFEEASRLVKKIAAQEDILNKLDHDQAHFSWCNQNGHPLISVYQNIKDDPLSEMLKQFIESVKDYHRAQITELKKQLQEL